MARSNAHDRGLYSRLNRTGKLAWYVRVSVYGRMRNFGSFPTKPAALAFRDRVKASLRETRYAPGQTPPTTLTVKELVEEYLPLASDREAYREQKRFGQWWTDYCGERPVLSLLPEDLERAKRTLRSTGRYGRRQINTVARYMEFLRHAMRRLVRPRAWVIELWANVPIDQPPKAPQVIATPEQEGQLHAELGHPDTDYARLGVLTGLRRGQLFSQRWDLLRWEQCGFVIPPFKRQPARFAPVPEEGMTILRRMHRAQGKPKSGWIFPNPKHPAQHLDPNNWYRRRFKPAAIRAGLYEKGKGVKFHTLRHTWADRMASKGAHPRVIQEAGAWSGLDMVERYTHPYNEAIRTAVERAARIKPKPVKLRKTATSHR